MIKSYLTIAIRLFTRHKFFSAINAFGLALGMSVSLLLISFYARVSSFDSFHMKKDDIYRVITTVDRPEKKQTFASAPPMLSQKLLGETSIERVVCINSSFRGDVVSNKLSIPIHGYYASENFFSVFDFEMIQGNPAEALAKPRSIVLTESVAQKLSSSGDILGQSLEVEGLGLFEVTGVVRDQTQTHFLFEVLVSLTSLAPDKSGTDGDPHQWTDFTDQYIYLLTKPSLSYKGLQQSLNRIAGDVNTQTKDATITFDLQALRDITPGPDLENSIGPDTDYVLIIVFATICLLILLPACFNYANLTIAHALRRSKEVGLRKTLGGSKRQIFFQFVTETIATVTIALGGAMLIFFLIRPEFEGMMPGNWLRLDLTWGMVVSFFVFAVMTGFVTGVLPALYFGRLNPVQALKGSTMLGHSRMNIRKLLIIGQFALSFCFIVLLIVFGRQYQYNLNYDYGFNAKRVLDVKMQDVNPSIFRTEFSKLASVENISMSSHILGLTYSSTYLKDGMGDDSTKVFQVFCDASYAGNMELQFMAGHNFPEDPVSTERYMVVNEEFLRTHQIANAMDALGKTYSVDGKDLEVIGVLKDFHFAPITEPIRSFILRNEPSKYTYANVRIKDQELSVTMASLEHTWDRLSIRNWSAQFFETTIDELFYRFYKALFKMIGFLGLIAISITLLGLLGMVMYTIEPRAREVGIRKVFGASDTGMNFLLSKDFLKLMGWGIGLGIPVSILSIDNFLSLLQYYRVHLNVLDIVVALVIFFVMGIGTIIFQIRKISKASAADTLRHH